MKVVVIGGAGYIGSHVVKALLARDYQVKVYDNLSTGQEVNYFPEVENVVADILDYPSLVRELTGFDAVIHLAAFKAVGESMEFPEKYSINNIMGTLNVLNAMTATKIPYFVFSSSAAIFGEGDGHPIEENASKNPSSFYGFTKLEIERFLAWYDRLKNIKSASLRYFNAAGYDPDGVIQGLERNPANLIPVIMEAAFGIRSELVIFGNDYPTDDGTCIRDYIHVSDLAEAHVKSLEYLALHKESIALNLGTGKGLSVQEVYDEAMRVHGSNISMRYGERRAGDPAQLIAASNKAQDLLHWIPQYSDRETLIRTTYQAYQRHYRK
ncbi:UDP-glucose 4-epimerase GalE [Entomospira entomophila]|uniref:UDP-glucose 4-epimerase n=1 Tax=Entomospira entomophila TaxID=2719988 RepID=A0A968GC23_9SPIO|nr:UDP-glucose 4-epimerase GalE [Entomospira entomophilus]NIZ40631.1 UDP-glucose 4-epimerase GalE [Entomospira entomophilus]WDI34845.1 UDP-glucose 4-epimerase GalE [Entomospira entomophilus]